MNKKGRFELPYILAVSDGTTTIDLTKPPFALIDWKPNTSPYKSGGTYSESPLSNGRRLIDAKRENIKDSISLSLGTLGQDQNIREERDLRALLQKGIDFWTNGWQSTPVYLIAQSSRETNIRYAQLYTATIPSDNYLYGQPFVQSNGNALQVDLVIECEHTEWMSNPPGIGECLPLKLVTNLNSEGYIDEVLAFDPVGAWKLNEVAAVPVVNYSQLGSGLDGTYSGAGILYDDAKFTNGDSTNLIGLGGNYYIDLFSADLASNFNLLTGTVIVWQYNTGVIWTSGFVHGFFALIIDANRYIKVYKSAVNYELVCEMKYGSLPAATITYDLTNVVDIDKWFSVGVTWTNVNRPSNSTFLSLFFRGQRVAGQIIFGRLTGTLSQFVLGNTDIAASDTLSGNLAYCQYYDEVLSSRVISQLSTPPLPLSVEYSCEQDVHFANKHIYAALTHIFAFDASLVSYSANLLDAALPYNLFPASPAVGDISYFIIDTTTANPFPSGRFSNIVFDLVAGVGLVYIYEYWNGAAWTTLTAASDNTSGFEIQDVHAISWIHPSNQATTTINGVTGWIFRVRITSVSSPTGPQQQNRQPYTVTWPFVEIRSSDIGGDIAGLARHLISNVSASYFVSPTINTLHTNRVIAGLRSLSRGSDYTPYLNISDQQLAQGTSVVLGSNTTFSTATDSATGRSALYSTMTVEAMQTEVTLSLDNSVSAQYLGKYKMFLRGTPVHSGFAAYCQIKVSISPNVVIFTTEKIDLGVSVAVQSLFDFGRLVIGQDTLLQDDISNQLTFEIQIQNTANSAFNFSMYELILMPIDEWSIDTSSVNENTTGNEGGILAGEYISLDIDSIYNPKYSPRSLIRSELLGSVVDRYKVSSPGDAIVQANADQRLWFVSSAYVFDAFGTEFSKPFVTYTARSEKNQRYRSARGDS